CFSLRPQPACNAHCQPTQKVEKKIDFHCVSDSSASRHWAQMIKKGANPDFSQKGANKSLKVNIPESCRA
ncbi:vitellogenin-1-like, partial [Frankliniella occidentalis]|uniref:Vitellogenin-1-like n=2 Tax=Frankliniella TaxID=45059 RepID=A0A9C6XD58_FRAOC